MAGLLTISIASWVGEESALRSAAAGEDDDSDGTATGMLLPPVTVITGWDMVKNPLYGQPMVNAVEVWKKWAPANMSFLHALHPDLRLVSGRADVLPSLYTNRYLTP